MPGGPITHNYSWQLPMLGGDPTVWGQELNTVLGQVDAVVFNNNFAITAQLTSYNLTLTKTVGSAANVIYNGVVGTSKERWAVGVDGLAEAGSNTNSNFHINAFDDNGVLLGAAMAVTRANQAVNFPSSVSIGGSITVTGASTFTGSAIFINAVSVNAGLTANSLSVSGNATAGGSFQGPDTGGAACLLDATGLNTWSFRWDGTWGYYRINHGAAEITIATGQARNLNYVAGGGPIGVVLNGTSSGGVLYGTYCDAACDERIKENIRPSSVDALQIVNAIQIDEFDIKASVAGWFEATNEPSREERARFMREARPRHVPIGVVAQKLKALIPEAVYASPQDDPPDDSPLPPNMLTLADAALTPYLLRAIQQLTERIQALEAKLAA